MYLLSFLTVILACTSLTAATPITDSTLERASDLRLIKTSAADPGKWVTEEEKISKYAAKKIAFVDITDIKDPEALAILSKPTEESFRVAAVVYPTTLTQQTQANALIAKTSDTGPKSWLTTLTNFYNRYYRSSYGTQASTWVFNQVKSISASNPAITVSQFSHSFSQPSIIARIPGTSSNLIIVGGHFDSTGGSSTARGPGADDNGSGCVTIMEALRVLADNRYAPKNTIEFHFYAGEEGGLLGSADVYRNYKATGKNVLAFVNQDMTGYSPSGKISVYSDYVDTSLTAYVRRIVTGYIGSYTTDSCGYACGDHASANSNGFPSAYVCDEPDRTSSPYIHSPDDYGQLHYSDAACQVYAGILSRGKLPRWDDNKGFGFILRDSDGSSAFCHVRELQGIKSLLPGSKVSFVFEYDEKGGKAKQVLVEEAVEEVEQVRESGTVKRWNAEKGFGFIGRNAGGDDAFVHKKDCGGNDLIVGQAVSFVFEEGAKGASAKHVKEEEGGGIPPVEEDEGEREQGRVKSYNEEKGFAFIGRCVGGEDLFAHKKEFGSLEPHMGMGVSFVVETTEKGDAAKKIRMDDDVPELALSDEGREFGTIKLFIADKGYGFIVRKNGGENARFFEKQCNGITPEKDLCVSFVLEESDKGPSAKDLREEDPERVARVTAKVHYGKVEKYFDPTPKKPTNGYGFIVPFERTYGMPERYYFHMDEIMDPDEEGGIDIETNVSFIVIAARKGQQAAQVTIADPPPKDTTETEAPSGGDEPALQTSFADMGVTETLNTGPVDLDDPNAW